MTDPCWPRGSAGLLCLGSQVGQQPDKARPRRRCGRWVWALVGLAARGIGGGGSAGKGSRRILGRRGLLQRSGQHGKPTGSLRRCVGARPLVRGGGRACRLAWEAVPRCVGWGVAATVSAGQAGLGGGWGRRRVRGRALVLCPGPGSGLARPGSAWGTTAPHLACHGLHAGLLGCPAAAGLGARPTQVLCPWMDALAGVRSWPCWGLVKAAAGGVCPAGLGAW